MKDNFFKFPSTPHLALLGSIDIREDKILSEAERNEFLRHVLTVEEKIDGANLGISFDSSGNILVQNRGAYLHLPSSGQWKKLSEWLGPRVDTFFDHLADRYILFGEWCYALHSVSYNKLPDWFLGFDIFDKQAKAFFSCSRRDELFQLLNIYKVPLIARGSFTLLDLEKLLLQSKFSDQPAEGLYCRIDHNSWLKQRAKLVRPTFIQAVEQHWSQCGIRPNQIRYIS